MARGMSETRDPGWREVRGTEMEGICDIYKFKTVGWRNVSVWGFVGLMGVAVSIVLLSVEGSEEELWLEKGVAKLGTPLRPVFRVPKTVGMPILHAFKVVFRRINIFLWDVRGWFETAD